MRFPVWREDSLCTMKTQIVKVGRRFSIEMWLGFPRLVVAASGRYFSGKAEKHMQSTVIGGAMLPHAPQFFTMPATEDKANVARVKEVAAEIGRKLRALEPDLWIIFSNDHAEQFFHNV